MAGGGYRNGVRPRRLKTAEGVVAYSAPAGRQRRRAVPLRASRASEGPSEALEDLAIEMLVAGSKEDAETVSAFFQDMRSRGLNDPLLVVSDGASGIVKAIGASARVGSRP